MVLFVRYLLQQLVLSVLLQLQMLLCSAYAQWITVAEFSMRVPGQCNASSGSTLNTWRQYQFDCGGSTKKIWQQQRCISLRRFHDGIVDCPDGSDEFCFPGYVKCGTYCVLPQHIAQCLINPRCDDSPTAPTFCGVNKEKLCPVEGTVPCKGYGDCVMKKWIEQGQTNCIDKSDEDLAYIAVFGIKRGVNPYPSLHVPIPLSSGAEIINNPSSSFFNPTYVRIRTPNWLQQISTTFLPPSVRGGWLATETHQDIDGTTFGTLVEAKGTSATSKSTTTPFVFRIPSEDINNKIHGWLLTTMDNTVVGFTNPTMTIPATTNDFMTPSHNMQKTVAIQGQHGGQHTYGSFQKFSAINQIHKEKLENKAVSSVKAAGSYSENGNNSGGDSEAVIPDDRTKLVGKITWSMGANGNNDVVRKGNSNNGEQVSTIFQERQNGPNFVVVTEAPLEHRDTKKQDISPISNVPSSFPELENFFSSNVKGAFGSVTTEMNHQMKEGSRIRLPNETKQIISPLLKNVPSEEQQYRGSNTPHSSNNTGALASSTDRTTTTPSPDQLACARHEYSEARRLVANPWCTCPPGQMPRGDDDHCEATIVSTFGVDVQDFCAGIRTNVEESARLAILVLSRTGLPYRACVRHDGPPVMVQMDCSQCSVAELKEAFIKNAKDQYIPLRIMELSLGACLTATLNDCDPEHAYCLVDGPRYHCRCHEGWNDTSEEIGKAEGRRCEQLILAEECIIFLGYCLLWWFLLLGIILFLLLPLMCLAGWCIHKWCLKRGWRNGQRRLIASEAGSAEISNPMQTTIGTTNASGNPTPSRSKHSSNEKPMASSFGTKHVPIKSGSNKVADQSKVFLKQKNVQSLDKWDEAMSDGVGVGVRAGVGDNDDDDDKTKRQKTQSSIPEQAIIDANSEQQINAACIENGSHISSRESSKQTKSKISTESSMQTTEEYKDQSENDVLASEQNISKKAQISEESEEMIEREQSHESTDSKMLMKQISEQASDKSEKETCKSLISETSLRTMWEIFKQSSLKQPTRPSSIKSSTSSLDRLIDVFLCRRNGKIQPIPNITTEFSLPLDTADPTSDTTAVANESTNIVSNGTNIPIAVAPQSATTNCNIDTRKTVLEPILQQPLTIATTTQAQMQVIEQKIVTEVKTMTTTSIMPLLPGEVPMQPLKATLVATSKPLNVINSNTNAVDISDSEEKKNEETIQNSLYKVKSFTENEVKEQTNPINNDEQQPFPEIVVEPKEGQATITVSNNDESEDERSKQQVNEMFLPRTLRKIQSEYDGRLLKPPPYENTQEKTPPTANELKEALKKVTSMKPPKKRLTEKQKEKLSVSCEHLHIYEKYRSSDNKGGSLSQLLANSNPRIRYPPQRKLSSISEKSADLTSGGEEFVVAPSSVSCPTTTRISKGHKQLPNTLQNFRSSAIYDTRQYIFADLRASMHKKCALVNDNSNTKLHTEEESTTSSRSSTATLKGMSNLADAKRNKYEFSQKRTITQIKQRNIGGKPDNWQQHPISVVDAQTLKAGELDRITQLRPDPRYSQHRKWLSTFHLAHSQATVSKREDQRRQSDCNLRETLRTHAITTYGNSPIRWTPNGTQNSSRPVKEKLWWGRY